jgi:hypothetical protein
MKKLKKMHPAIAGLKNCCTFAFEHYNIYSWARNQVNFFEQDKGKPIMVVRKEMTVQPQTPSVCCDVHTYGGLAVLLQFLFAMNMSKNFLASLLHSDGLLTDYQFFSYYRKEGRYENSNQKEKFFGSNRH